MKILGQIVGALYIVIALICAGYMRFFTDLSETELTVKAVLWPAALFETSRLPPSSRRTAHAPIPPSVRTLLASLNDGAESTKAILAEPPRFQEFAAKSKLAIASGQTLTATELEKIYPGLADPFLSSLLPSMQIGLDGVLSRDPTTQSRAGQAALKWDDWNARHMNDLFDVLMDRYGDAEISELAPATAVGPRR